MLKPPVGILGGTFDPVHIGHLRPAIEARDALGLAEVRLIPNHIPPHRANPLCSSEQRLAMVRLAAAENPGFVVDERELKRDKPSWTIDTLIELRGELPDTPLCFLMGMDSLLTLPSWHRWQELLDYAHLVVSLRPGWQPDYPADIAGLLARHGTRRAEDLHLKLSGHIWLADNLPIALSATRLRDLLARGQDTRYLLPACVAHYIEQEGLYRTVAENPQAGPAQPGGKPGHP
ncbi:nicotinate-nucleotide adenylyltransferase [Aeromonas bivalvium]|uniref:nicotinate-nucleotide adenylyltransferase n=1 Tax=Aeromonas bivalvium TaxID=440079 RepID=UPI00370B96A4